MTYSASKPVLELAARSVAARKRIDGHILKTPCLRSRMDQPEGTSLYYKTENFQTTGSFKLRGAMSKLTSLGTEAPVITASSGNHGIACSLAAQVTGHRLTVVLPEAVAQEKLNKIKSFGTNVILRPGDPGLAEQHAQSLAATGDYVYVSPYNDTDIMAGQGTIGLELLEQMPQIDNVFISMGGGGLISGVGSVLKAFSPGTRIIGVSAIHSAALAASIEAGKVVETEHLETLADGCAGGVDENSATLALATEVIDQVVHCSEDQIAAALRDIAWNDKMLVEGAAALALAAYRADPKAYAGKVNVILLCGANFDQARIQSVIAA
jgi:threonine dehydratase